MTANTILQAREAPADEKLRQGGAGSAPAEAALPLLEAAEAILGKLTPDVVLALLSAACAWYAASSLQVAMAERVKGAPSGTGPSGSARVAPCPRLLPSLLLSPPFSRCRPLSPRFFLLLPVPPPSLQVISEHLP